jgi:hypothetical protein
MKDRKEKQFMSGDWYHWERGGHKERVKGNMVEVLYAYV